MKDLIKDKKWQFILAGAAIMIIAQAVVIALLYSKKDHKSYEVNLVKINSQKDSVDYARMKYNLQQVDDAVGDLSSFLASKNITNARIEMLEMDSIASAVYLAKQSNRYSQYLVDLEKKLQQVPLGMPSEGYVSSNFGNRKNPIPYRTVMASVNPLVKSAAEKVAKAVPEKAVSAPAAPVVAAKRKVISAHVVEEKDSAGNVRKVVVPVYAPEEKTAVSSPVPSPQKTSVATISSGSATPKTSTKAVPVKEVNNPPAEADQIQFHKGIDIAVPYGSDVRCTAQGTVIFAGVKGGYGNCVIISHGNGLATLYAHLSQIVVRANEKVKVGQVIAKSGNSGRSTGPHLHYEVHKNNTPVNPKLFLNF